MIACSTDRKLWLYTLRKATVLLLTLVTLQYVALLSLQAKASEHPLLEALGLTCDSESSVVEGALRSKVREILRSPPTSYKDLGERIEALENAGFKFLSHYAELDEPFLWVPQSPWQQLCKLNNIVSHKGTRASTKHSGFIDFATLKQNPPPEEDIEEQDWRDIALLLKNSAEFVRSTRDSIFDAPVFDYSSMSRSRLPTRALFHNAFEHFFNMKGARRNCLEIWGTALIIIWIDMSTLAHIDHDDDGQSQYELPMINWRSENFLGAPPEPIQETAKPAKNMTVKISLLYKSTANKSATKKGTVKKRPAPKNKASSKQDSIIIEPDSPESSDSSESSDSLRSVEGLKTYAIRPNPALSQALPNSSNSQTSNQAPVIVNPSQGRSSSSEPPAAPSETSSSEEIFIAEELSTSGETSAPGEHLIENGTRLWGTEASVYQPDNVVEESIKACAQPIETMFNPAFNNVRLPPLTCFAPARPPRLEVITIALPGTEIITLEDQLYVLKRPSAQPTITPLAELYPQKTLNGQPWFLTARSTTDRVKRSTRFCEVAMRDSVGVTPGMYFVPVPPIGAGMSSSYKH